MRILVVNCGSSSLKFDVFLAAGPGGGSASRELSGVIEPIGGQAHARLHYDDLDRDDPVEAQTHGAAIGVMLDQLASTQVLRALDAVGHRVVHGGERLVDPTRIDDDVLADLRRVTDLAPLHNGPALAAIDALRDVLPDPIPMVAVFDTAFHRHLPDRASHYALPLDLAARHRVRRYGFHGLAHRYLSERGATLAGLPIEQSRLITLQLGNGASACAIEAGRSIDTTMGFTPLEGLMMGTRSGDVDPALPGYLARREGVPIEEIEAMLHTRSGLLGVSGRSADMRELLAAEISGDRRAALAVELFCYRARKQIGAYLAALGGADAVVFGGGIGERSPEVRARILGQMTWCGLVLDQSLNAEAVGREARISPAGTSPAVWAVPVDEASVIAADTVACLEPLA